MAAGGVLLDMGIHAIDLCHWLFGPVQTISAQTKTLIKRIPLDDNALMLLEFKNGAMGYIEAGWTSRPGFGGIEIYGTEGTIICDYWNGMKVCTGKAAAGRDSVYEWEMVEPEPLTGGWPAEIPYWLDVLDGKRKLDMNGQAGRAALEVALAAYKSSQTGRRISIGG
jgi:UDP-N-acetyl-2-amino-2-deoxyglucuronate dehydrogenase